MTTQPTALTQQIAAAGYTLPDHIAYDVEHHTQTIARSLQAIISRATSLLDDLNNADKACGTISLIASSAGASGPIGSQWESVVVTAARVDTAITYSLVRNDSEVTQ